MVKSPIEAILDGFQQPQVLDGFQQPHIDSCRHAPCFGWVSEATFRFKFNLIMGGGCGIQYKFQVEAHHRLLACIIMLIIKPPTSLAAQVSNQPISLFASPTAATATATTIHIRPSTRPTKDQQH